MAYSQSWLEDQSAIRAIFAEITVHDVIAAQDVVLYLSNIGYLTSDSLTSYTPIITNGLQITESISIDGSISLSFGDLEINNPNGDYDSWLDSTKYIWVNKPIHIYVGDVSWVAANLTQIHTDFLKVFDGVIVDIDSKAREKLNIKIGDKLQRLNTPLTENKLGTYGTWGSIQSNQDTIRPLVFGEVFNITPLLIDPSQLEYMFSDTNIGTLISNTTAGTNLLTCISTNLFTINSPIVFTGTVFGNIVAGTTYYISTINSINTFTISATIGGAVFTLVTASGPISNLTLGVYLAMMAECKVTATERVIEIRDNGVPIYNSSITTNATVDLVNGKFKLLHPLAATCTASIQGVPISINLSTGVLSSNAYTNNIASIIATIVTQYGNIYNRLAITDLDLTNLYTFSINNPHAVGISVTDTTNVLNICQALSTSVGAQLYSNRQGLLQLLQIGIPTSDASVTITDNDILHHSLNISNRVPVVAATKLGYCKNWSVQAGILTAIPLDHRDMMALDWYSTTITDSTVKTAYALNSDPVQLDTMLVTSIAANTVATRLNTYYKVPRTVYKFTGTSKLLSLKLGQPVVLQHNRFNLSVGASGQVITLSPNWLTSTVDIEVLI